MMCEVFILGTADAAFAASNQAQARRRVIGRPEPELRPWYRWYIPLRYPPGDPAHEKIILRLAAAWGDPK